MHPLDSQSPTVRGPADRLGRYELLHKLGEGGMGAVYLARDAKLDRRVAVKVLPEHAARDPEAVARFRREARALAHLCHPGVVQVYDADEADGRQFLIMEYIEGESLADVLAEQGRLPPSRAADYVHQAALALEHAHGKGLIHRDLKPSNLLLTPDGRVKVLDLGLARFLGDQIDDPGKTLEGVGMGTPDYNAPEQVLDARNADARSDVYALGCTLYHLLTGQVPFPGWSLSEKQRAHQLCEPEPVDALCPEAPAGLAQAVRRMMAKRPADRFPSAGAVAEALAAHVAGSSTSFAALRASASWQRGRALTALGARRRSPPLWVGAGVLAAVVLLLPAVLAASRMASPAAPARASRPDPAAPPAAAAEPAVDANVLTVAQTGRAQFRSINEALEHAKPGMTIRVLDDAVYAEPLAITRPRLHAGVTLEAVAGAALKAQTDANLVEIGGVPNFTLRGFHLDAAGTKKGIVWVFGACPGLVLEKLDLKGAVGHHWPGMEIAAVPDLDDPGRPVLVRDCVVRGVHVGVYVNAEDSGHRTSETVAYVDVRDNLIEDCDNGVAVRGLVRHIHVVGNRLHGVTNSALQLDSLHPASADVLVANNTVCESHIAFWYWDEEVRGKDVQVRNNLFLACAAPDMVFVDSGGSEADPRGPGDGAAVARVWRLDHNWREARAPAGDTPLEQAWIPPSPGDVLRDHIDGVERSAADPGAFLRPAAGSPLADHGAGADDPALPPYIGALPPKGGKPWNWDRAWKRVP